VSSAKIFRARHRSADRVPSAGQKTTRPLYDPAGSVLRERECYRIVNTRCLDFAILPDWTIGWAMSVPCRDEPLPVLRVPLTHSSIVPEKTAVQLSAVLDSIVGRILAATHTEVRGRMFAGEYLHTQTREAIDHEYKGIIRQARFLIRLIRQEQRDPETSDRLSVVEFNRPFPFQGAQRAPSQAGIIAPKSKANCPCQHSAPAFTSAGGRLLR